MLDEEKGSKALFLSLYQLSTPGPCLLSASSPGEQEATSLRTKVFLL